MVKSENSKIKYVLEEFEYNIADILSYIDNISAYSIDLLDKDGICIKNSDRIIFKFVGVICINDNIIIALPKYYIPVDEGKTYSENDIFDSTINILKILRRYPKNKAKQFIGEFFLDDNIESTITSEISLADYIIRDFIQNRLYDNVSYQLEFNAEGDTDWGYTIDNITPYISESGPIYSDTYNYKRYDDIHNKVIDIHKCVLNECIEKYSKLLGYGIGKIDSTYTKLNQIGSTEEILSIIERELYITFNQSKIDLLKCMYNIISRQYDGRQQGNYSLFGTKSFEHVWEHVVGEVFLNEKSKFIGKTKSNQDKEDDDISQKNIMDRPIWLDTNGNLNSNKKKTLEPDFIKIENERLYILDAKYYNIEYVYRINKNKQKELVVKGNPGIDSITKQFLYEKILEKRIPEKYPHIKIKSCFNAFIYPSRFNIPNLSDTFGKVRLDIFDDNIIYNICIDAEKLYKLYLNNDSYLCEKLL